jgi:S-formylglutathione hydrolase FrmB
MNAPGRRYRSPTLWRRRLLAIAAVAVVGIIAWRLIDDALRTDTSGASVEHFTIHSKAVGRGLPVDVVLPPGADESGRRLPMLVFLHGRGGDQGSEQVDQFFAALAKLGGRAPIVAFPYGGDHSYWHNRADGNWGNYVVDEVIPQVAQRYDANPHRVAIGGISMGGFGAFDLALHFPGRFCAVGGHGPALWQTGGETAPGAFDDAEDFDRNNVIGAATANPAPFTSQPVWLDAGAQDPFQPGDQAFADELRNDGADATIKLDRPGGHDSDYWNAHWSEYLRFYAAALSNCNQAN